MAKSRASKERREARRQRDREWMTTKIVQLRMLGIPPGHIEHLKTLKTRGELQIYISRWGKYPQYAKAVLSKEEYIKFFG